MIIRNKEKNMKQFSQIKEQFKDTLKQFDLTRKSMETMDDFCGYLWNRKNFQNIPLLLQHILFYCKSDLIGYDFCKCLADVLFREKLISTNDVIQLKDISDQEFVLQKNVIYYIFLSSQEDIVRVHKLLSEYWENCNKEYVQDKIVVVGLEANSELHEILYNADDGHHLFFRLLHHHVTSSMEEREHIFYLLWKRFQAAPYEFNQEFANTLRDYVLTIYPKREIPDADDFMSDIERRVYSLYWGKHVSGEIAGAECVPKYKKAETTVAPEADPEQDQDQDQNQGEGIIDSTENSEDNENQEDDHNYRKVSICNDASWMYQENSDEKYDNILLLTMSTLNFRQNADKTQKVQQTQKAQEIKKVQQNLYSYEGIEEKVNGYGQLEPVPKMLACKLHNEKQKLDLIIILASKLTKEPVDSFETVPLENKEGQIRDRFENVSAVDFFIHQIHNDSNCEETKFFVIDSEDEKTAIRKAADQLRSIHEKNQNMNLYVDMHGGPRTNQLLVDAILSLLKMDGIYVKDAFNVPGGGKDAKIVNALDAVRMFDFVSGMNEFISYGLGKGILRYVDQQGDYDEKYKGFVECIKEISDALLLCDVIGFEEALDKLNVMKLENKGGNEAYIDMFIENIKKDYGDLLDQEKRTLLKEIKWAQGKYFYQQCLAIIEAKTPEFVFGKFISFNEDSIDINEKKISLQEFYKDVRKEKNDTIKSCIAKALLFSREYRQYEFTGKAAEYNNCWRIEYGRVAVHVTYASKNKQQWYKIKFVTNLTQKDKFKEFVDIWRELKLIRNDVVHVDNNKKWTIEEVDERIDRYRSYYDVLNKNADYVLARLRK